MTTKDFLVCYEWDRGRLTPNFAQQIYINPEYIISIKSVDYENTYGDRIVGYQLIVDNRETTMQIFTFDLEKTYDNTTDL